MAVDDQSEISFSIPRGMLPWQPFVVNFIQGNKQDVNFCGTVGIIHRTDSLDAGG